MTCLKEKNLTVIKINLTLMSTNLREQQDSHVNVFRNKCRKLLDREKKLDINRMFVTYTGEV